MAYTTEENVKAEFRELKLTETSAVKSSDVSLWIRQADAYINTLLRARYLLPIEDSEATEEALLVLGQISTYMVADRIRAKLEVKTATAEIQQDVRPRSLLSKAEGMLKAILDGDILLPGVPEVSAQAINSFNIQNWTDYTFSVDRQQW